MTLEERTVGIAHNYDEMLRINEYDVSYIDYDRTIPAPELVDRYKKEYNINTDCAKECILCQIHQIEKYKNFPRKPGQSPFQIKCNFIPKSYGVAKSLEGQFTEEEKQLVVAYNDPVTWAKHFLGWEARSHQKVILRCSADKVIQRLGRRAGKTAGSAIRILFDVFTKKVVLGKDFASKDIVTGTTIMVIAPHLSQIVEVFTEMFSLLKRNEEMLNTLKGLNYRKNPFHQMEFTNGARILGFTTGQAQTTGDKGGGKTIRGYGAHRIYVDEADFMNAENYSSTIMPIFHEEGKRYISVSSTPKGSREKFYTWAMESPDWKEFHAPITISDTWEEKKDSIISESSLNELLQEYMAVFLSEAAGVYQAQFIAKAKDDQPYEYKDVSRHPDTAYSIGVDWNSNAGTEICVIGLDRRGHNWLAETINIPQQGWTQIAAMNSIIDLNRKWRPKFIYVDTGYGAVAIELLQNYSLQMRYKEPGSPDCDIFDILKGYEFGGKIQIRDPSTGEIIKKPSKDFMIQNSVRRFEEGTIHIPLDEVKLVKQLFNYVVGRVATSGQRIYAQSNPKIGDHRLDAFNLALVAYKLEMSDFSLDADYVTTVRHGGKYPGSEYKNPKHNMVPSFDIKYPEGYMEYNLDREGNKKGKRSNLSSNKDTMLGGQVELGKPIVGGTMKQMRPGFDNDTEHLHRKSNSVQAARRKMTSAPIRRSNV